MSEEGVAVLCGRVLGGMATRYVLWIFWMGLGVAMRLRRGGCPKTHAHAPSLPSADTPTGAGAVSAGGAGLWTREAGSSKGSDSEPPLT